MNTQLQSVINTALKLEAFEQLELIQAISESLQRNYSSKMNFWQPQSLESTLQIQPTQTVSKIADLGADFWPENETADDIIQYIYQQRQEDRLQQ
jgi:hypothetical protein